MKRVPPTRVRVAHSVALCAAIAALALALREVPSFFLVLALLAAGALAIPFAEWTSVPPRLARALPRVLGMTLLVIAGVAWLSRALGVLVLEPDVRAHDGRALPRPDGGRLRARPAGVPDRTDALAHGDLHPRARRPQPRARRLRPVGAALPEGRRSQRLRRAVPRPRARGPRSALGRRARRVRTAVAQARRARPRPGGRPRGSARREPASWVCRSSSRRSSGPWPRPSTRGRRVCRASRRSGSSRSWRCRAAASSTCERPTRRPARGSCARRSSPTSTGASGGMRRARPEPSGPGRRAFCNPALRRLVWARSSPIPARGFPRSQPARRRTQTRGGPRSRSSSTSRTWGAGPSCCRTASPP